MEGDAGASRLNPIDADDSLSTEVTTEDSSESEVGADQDSTEVTTEDSSESEVGADQDSTEEAGVEGVEESGSEVGDVAARTAVERRPPRLRRGWLVGICAALVLAAAGIGTGGYLALRSNQQGQAIARNDAAALQAAKDCVAATQAPDTTAMAASEQKIIDCGTDQYRSQAVLYSSMLVQAYQAANVHVQVSDMRAAVERNNPDGSVEVLVALRVRVSNDQAQNQETGYRLRVRMAPVEGQYKISKLDQVTK
ncbi:Mce protein [Mycobacterium shinjukuense]|uniref:Membrane protein n=1 Tax=Mycobacterium shinjukuense TaxID=398694 RepID=A0A7I7MV50_9MYCO|nr:Mce protein [Mycobacterium shinjukuense]MCV6986117.1 Mce protein [Mycobacterium shinjukuense]ORB72352.1 Mce protein [Mycobacterium shinjukuense]BBX75393.1 membrane protein [Mycobacterium shinjukuense]